jgi:predicted Fe-Mo cluster-binding NifX family protein
MNAKIAVVTQDEIKISAHFGMAPLYRVFTIEAGKIVARETRAKPHHERHPEHGSHEHKHHHHADMLAPVADCQVLIVAGMGSPAFAKAQASGLTIILTAGEIEAAIQAYLDGELQSDQRRIHIH